MSGTQPSSSRPQSSQDFTAQEAPALPPAVRMGITLSSLRFTDGVHLSREDLVETRATQLSRAMAREGIEGFPTVRFGFLMRLASTTIDAKFDAPAWDALVAVLSAVERPFYRYASHATTGISNLLYATGPLGTEAPATKAEWSQITSMLVNLDRERDRPSNKLLRNLPEMFLRIIRLEPPAELLATYAKVACRGLAHGRSISTIERDLEMFTESMHFLNDSEVKEVVSKMLQRTIEIPDRTRPVVSSWDVAAARLRRLQSLGIDPHHALDSLDSARKNAKDSRPEGPSSTTLAAFIDILDATSEICVEIGDTSGISASYTVDVFASMRSSKVSLAILNDTILPHYRTNKWPVGSILRNFAPAGDDPDSMKFQKFVVEGAIAAGMPVEPFITRELLDIAFDSSQRDVVAVYLRCFSDPELARHPALSQAQALYSISGELVAIAKHGAAVWKSDSATIGFLSNVLDLVDCARRRIGPKGDIEKPLKYLRQSINELFELECSSSVFSQIARLARSDEIHDIDGLIGYICDVKCHWALFRKMQGAEAGVEDAASRVLASDYNHDSVPYRRGDNPDPRAYEAHRELQHFLWRLFNPSKGFSAWTCEARKIPGEQHSAIVEFGLDLAHEVSYLNSSSIENFPGNGFVIKGLRLDQALLADESHEDPYHQYRENWPFARNLEDWEDTRFVFTRGFLAITGPDNERFKLPAAKSPEEPDQIRDEHYTTIIFNDHFHNPSCHVACAIPTHIFNRLLKGAETPAESYKGYDPKRPDITQLEMTYEALEQLCRSENVNLIDLGWPSNAGGLCNSYPVASDPFHRWEHKPSSKPVEDRAGHIHKSFILDHYSAHLSVANEKALQPLRELHSRVLRFGNSSLDCLDGIKIFQALWHKGQTLARPGSLGEMPAYSQSDSKVDSQTDEQRRLEREDNDKSAEEFPPLGPYSARRLREIYLHHQASQKPGVDQSRTPIFRVSKAMDLWPTPSPLEIDPTTLILKTAHYEIQLPLDGTGFGDEELEIWREYVMPHAQSSNDFRFWARASQSGTDKERKL